MRPLAPLAAFLFAFAPQPTAGKAPVPKDEPKASIEGKYNLTSVVSAANAGGAAGGVIIGGGGPGGAMPAALLRDRTLTYLPGPASITKNQIIMEGRGPAGAPAAILASLNLPVTMEYTVVDATKTLIQIDVFNVSPRGKKLKMPAVAEVIDDRLIIAVAREGEERPKNTEEAEGVTVYYFAKAPPPPKVEFKIVAMTVGKEADAEKELNKLAQEGYELVSTTQPSAPDAKSSPTTVHFVLKRTGK